MAPKAKAKGKPKAKAEAAEPKAKAEPKANADAKAKVSASSGAPAAGSGTAAVRQSKLDAATAEIASASSPASAAAAETVPAEPAAVEADACNKANANEADATIESAGAEANEEAVSDPKGDVKEEKKVELSDIADPWASVADEAALTKIRKEEWQTVEPGDEEPSGPAHLAARDADLDSFVPTEAHREFLISAEFSGNSLPSIAAIGGPMWLRALGLANNPLESFAGLSENYPRLLWIDISFIELSGVDGAWEALAACPCLRRLTVEGCSLASFEDMKPMPRLRVLEAQDNAIETVEDVATLRKRCPDLLELDLRENDVATEGGYIKKVKALFPKLTKFDDQGQKVYVAETNDKAYANAGDLNKEINAVDGMWKNEGCSCVEGNPCVDPESCKDWKHREAVAADARKRKGLRDDSGKQLF